MKPDWFKMRPAEFLSDTAVDAMTTQELGACFRLLCRQWIDGFIPDNLSRLARLCRLDATAMGEAWVTLCPFFPVVESGKRANRHMWIERETVSAELEKRSDEGTKAAHKRWGEARKQRDAEPNRSPNGSPMPEPMQEENRREENKTSSSEPQTGSDQASSPAQKKPHSRPSQQACSLAALLKSEILRNKPDYRITSAQGRNWEVTAQRMLDIDKRNPELIEKVIRWVQHDEFEMVNVLSMDKLRVRFDQLELKASAKGPKQAAVATLPASYVSASERIRHERSAGGLQ